jgi:hypothetical protein
MLRYASHRQVIRLSLLAVAAACSGGTEPKTADVAGSYSATAFTTTSAGTTTNQLSRGSTLALVLSAQGAVTGTLFIPDDGVSGTVNANMAGTWTLSGSTVSFTQNADTFVRDMSFTFANNTLVGDDTFSGTRIQVTLTRQ